MKAEGSSLCQSEKEIMDLKSAVDQLAGPVAKWAEGKNGNVLENGEKELKAQAETL